MSVTLIEEKEEILFQPFMKEIIVCEKETLFKAYHSSLNDRKCHKETVNDRKVSFPVMLSSPKKLKRRLLIDAFGIS